MMPRICRGSGDLAYAWQDGMFKTIYCICGAKITVTEGMPKSVKNSKYVYVPEHVNYNGKVQFVEAMEK